MLAAAWVNSQEKASKQSAVPQVWAWLPYLVKGQDGRLSLGTVLPRSFTSALVRLAGQHTSTAFWPRPAAHPKGDPTNQLGK